ncbi:winged helix-turn-helix domain-containing protein [Luteipulveratus mongoliensis]|uniref:Cytoplasmic protein n=1 Tax=Luteipulveratus mongoliensis TaxID=571913 RepID=A0A0K1JJT2_9MICO|nr:crosslink repair DNA glycosylase YcaQ family protein [Luteipulveratus mongoliensis]AKU16830.1 hypothetical protein VV02_14730 [Luteipulveratus mongoliensis]
MLTQDEARALAVRAQGFGLVYHEPVDVLRRLGAIQLDSVNAVARSHELTIFSRFGQYDVTALLDRIYADRCGFEYWGHSASWIDIADIALFQHRMARMRALGRGATTVNKQVRDEHADLYAEVLDRIDAEGPLTASDFAGVRPDGGWFNHKPVKRVLEDLYDQGVLMCAGRGKGFTRRYDRASQVLGTAAPDDPGSDEAAYRLVVRATARLGVATAKEVADYYRLQRWKAPWRDALTAAVTDGQVAETQVAGWCGTAYADPAALDGPLTPPEHRPAFLSPLDNLLWDRPRVKRVFGFEHTFEIYKKPERRRYGYYVLPLLAAGELGGRADLRYDRHASVLLVQGLWLEGATADAVGSALRCIADHLGADDISLTAPAGSVEADVIRRARSN